MLINLFFVYLRFCASTTCKDRKKAVFLLFKMSNSIPDIILNDATERGFIRVRFAGEFDGATYFNYVRSDSAHYSGLPAIVKLIDGVIEDVTTLGERLRAYNFAIKNEQ